VSVLAASVSGAHLARWYARNRERSRALFDLLDPAVYYSRPIALRNPIVFYEGHLPAFTVIALLQRGLGRPGVDDRLEQLFARGIDPESEEAAVPRSGADTIWPSRDEVLAYGAEVDQVIEEVLTGWEAPPPDAPLSALRERDAVFTALEHEAMHQETLLYMWRRLPYQNKRRPAGVPYETTGAPPPHGTVRIPAGRATLGARPGDILFGWDNEFGECLDEVPAFDIDVHSVTNADYLGFVADGGYDRQDLWSDDGWAWRVAERVTHPAFWIDRDGQWVWRGMFEDIPLPVARLREPCRGLRVRPLGGAAPADRGRVSPCRLRHARRGGAAAPVERHGIAAALQRAGQLRPAALGAGSHRVAAAGRERLGHPRSGRQRLGVDGERLRAVPRLHADADLSRVLG
jgi:hypothetical protein